MSVVIGPDGCPVIDHDFDYEDVGPTVTVTASDVKPQVRLRQGGTPNVCFPLFGAKSGLTANGPPS